MSIEQDCPLKIRFYVQSSNNANNLVFIILFSSCVVFKVLKNLKVFKVLLKADVVDDFLSLHAELLLHGSYEN